jgi:hypothetical protein
MIVLIIMSETLFDHNSHALQKIIYFSQKEMVTFCDHLSGFMHQTFLIKIAAGL